MQNYYSAQTKGFYDDVMHAGMIPDDAVVISQELYEYLLIGQSKGKVITIGDEGLPVLVDPPPPTLDELKASALARRDQLLAEAALRIAPLQDAVDLDDATDVEVKTLKKWKQYRVMLNRIDQQVGYPSEIDWPASHE